jgi:threonine dehydratase
MIETKPPTPPASGNHRLSLKNIEQASTIIDPVFRNTAQFECEPLSYALGTRVLVKVETVNPIRSFKGRGADYFVGHLAPGARVMAASAGNFGQALAYACRRRGIALTVYASVNANPLKVERMQALGAHVVLHGTDFDAAKIEAKRAAAGIGAAMVEDGREARLSEGAGSIAVELLHQPTPFEAVLVPLGNGALLGGVARWMKTHAPHVDVIGVAATGAPCMELSWRAGIPVETDRIDTIADGIGTRVPIPEALGDLIGTIGDILLVDDDAMIEGMRLAHRHLGLVLEPSGAAGLAALLSHSVRFRGRAVAAILSGGNLTPQQMQQWLT